MSNRSRFGDGLPSRRIPDHLIVAELLGRHAAVMRLESEVRCMKAEEDTRIAATWEAVDSADDRRLALAASARLRRESSEITADARALVGRSQALLRKAREHLGRRE